MVNGEQSQVASLRAQLAEAKHNLEQTVFVPQQRCATQILIRPGFTQQLPLRPVICLFLNKTANRGAIPPESAVAPKPR